MSTPFDRRLDVAALLVVGVARQVVAGQHRLGASREDGDAVPGRLALPHRAIAGIGKCGARKLPVARLQLLQADHVGLGFGQPGQQVGRAAG